MDEYPKVIQVGALTVTVASAAEEARWRADEGPEPEDVEPPPVEASDDAEPAEAKGKKAKGKK